MDSRGGSLVEYIVLVGAVAFVASVGVRALGTSIGAKAAAHAECVRTLACDSTTGGGDPGPISVHDPTTAPDRKSVGRLAPNIAARAAAALAPAPNDEVAGPEVIADPFEHTSKRPHAVRVLHEGADALSARLELIDGAQRRVDLAAFSFTEDRGGRLLLQALVRAAARGVQVRVLMDQYEHRVKGILRPEMADALASRGVELRYYNAAGWLRPLQKTRRNHQKSMVVDDARLIVGGRNNSDDYWDLTQAGFSYLDRDVLVEGPVARAAARSFDAHWTHEWSVPAGRAFPGRRSKGAASHAEDALTTSEADAALIGTLQRTIAAQRAASAAGTAPEVTWISDLPGPAGPNVMRCRRAILDAVSRARKSVLVEVWNIVLDAEEERLLIDLAARGVEVSILSNTFATDAGPQVAFGLETQQRLAAAGVNVFAVGGWAPPGHVDPSDAGARVWGTHAKTYVVDSSTVVIGSHNLNPRSRDLNAESAVILRDAAAVAGDVESSIWQRTRVAWRLGADGRFIGGPEHDFHGEPLLIRWLHWLKVTLARPFKGQY